MTIWEQDLNEPVPDHDDADEADEADEADNESDEQECDCE